MLIWHYQHFAMIGGDSRMMADHHPLAFLLWPIYSFGAYGVQFFWCISGFIFYWKYADDIAARTVEPRRFFWLRFSRLYPLHFMTLLIVALLQPLYAALAGETFVYTNGFGRFILQLGLADQWFGARGFSFNGPIWSVSAEIFVYVAFFLLIRTFGRGPLIIAAAISLALLSIWSGGSSPTMVCAGFFFAGGLAADWLNSDYVVTNRRQARVMAVTILGSVIALGFTFLDLQPNSPATATFILIICLPLIFLAAQDMPSLDRWQAQIQAAGNLTYSTYLIHFPIQLIVAIAALCLGLALPVGEAWFLLSYVAASIILGRIIFVRFEAPVQNMIRAATLSPEKRSVVA